MWSRSRAKVTAPALAKYPGSGSETLLFLASEKRNNLKMFHLALYTVRISV